MNRLVAATVAGITLAGVLVLSACARPGSSGSAAGALPSGATGASPGSASAGAASAGAASAGSGGSGPAGIASVEPSSNRPAALADAARLIATFVPPAQAVRLPAPPEAAQGLRSSQMGPNGSLVTQTRWYAVPGAPQPVLAALATPAGGRRGASGMSGGPDGSTYEQDFDFPPVAGVLYSRGLTVSAMAVGGKTILRVDAQVVFVPVRPASSLIPPSAASVVVQFQPGHVTDAPPKPLPPVTVRDRTKVAAIAAIVNTASMRPDNWAMACPFDGRAQMTLDFSDAAGRRLATVEIDPAGCGEVTVSVVGASDVALLGGAEMAQRIELIIRVSWPTMAK